MKTFHDMSACPPAQLPKDPTDVKKIVEVLLHAEQCAVQGYTEICNMTAGKDHRTYDRWMCSIVFKEIKNFDSLIGKFDFRRFHRNQEGLSVDN